MPSTFGTLLRRLRVAADLSQEALAEAAQVSTSSIGAYERGVHSAPHRDTVMLIADALKLSGSTRTEFEVAGRRKPRASAAEQGVEGETTFDNLPLEATSFIGRESEIDDLSAMLGKYRIVTITGIGGIGKTRIALRVAGRQKREFNDGVVFVDFGSILDDTLVASKVAASIGMVLRSDDVEPSTVFQRIGANLSARSVLLVFDNCEHLIEATGTLAAIIVRACPKVTILATSRERLRLTGEAVYRLGSLAIPKADRSAASTIALHEATALFMERAKAIDMRFTLTEASARAVVDICRRVDGIPLAIELAASHVVTLGVTSLRSQLDTHLSRLSGGNRDLPSRQRTLQATLSWSYELLQTHERLLLQRVSVFSGGWTLEAAQKVCADDQVPVSIVLEALESLVEKSLVTVNLEAVESRYNMLQITRCFALEKAGEAGMLAENRSRQGAWLAVLAVRAYNDFLTRPGGNWRAVYDAELDNARTALEWELGEEGDVVAAAEIMTGFGDVWTTNLLVAECRLLTETILSRIDHEKYPRLTGRLTFTLSTTSLGLRGVEEGERALSLMGQTEDACASARCWQLLGVNFLMSNQVARAHDALHEALRLFEAEGAIRLIAPVHSLLCAAALRTPDMDEAHRQFALAIKTAGAMEDAFAIQMLQPNLAESEFIMGNAAGALHRLDAAFPDFRHVKPRRIEVFLRMNRACFRIKLGELAGAEDDASTVLRLMRSNDEGISTIAVQHLATVAALRKDPIRAARLLGFIDAAYARSGSVTGAERIVYDCLTQSLREQLLDGSLAILRKQGAALHPNQAYDEALSIGDDQGSTAPSIDDNVEHLTSTMV